MNFIPNAHNEKQIKRLVDRLVKQPGKWIYTGRGRKGKAERLYVLNTTVDVLKLMGCNVECDPYHQCRIRIKPLEGTKK